MQPKQEGYSTPPHFIAGGEGKELSSGSCKDGRWSGPVLFIVRGVLISTHALCLFCLQLKDGTGKWLMVLVGVLNAEYHS